MANTVTIFNLALSSCGVRAAVAAPEDNLREAEICRTWYPIVRDHILRSAPWPSTKAHARLALLAEREFNAQWVSSDPDPTYRYAYGVPADMLAPRYLTDYQNFQLSIHNGTTAAIMTNAEDALLCYTRRQEDPNLWDTSLQLAIAFGLGSFICKPLTGKTSLAAQMRKEADELILAARIAAANTDTFQQETVPSWMNARGSVFATPHTQYIYPYSSLLSEMGATDVQ